MQAMILAAGMGRRLGAYTREDTKCMVEVNGVRLIDRALESLACAGVSRVILVIGYKGEKVRAHVGDRYKGIPVVYVGNPVYDRTNNIYSLFLAREYLLEDDTLLMESDLICEQAVIDRLVQAPYPNIALVDKFESWMDGTVVKIDAQGSIVQFIDRDGFRFEEIRDYYKTVNAYKFSRDFSRRYYVPFLTAYCEALGRNEYYEQVLNVIIHLRDAPLKAVPLKGEMWYEIDDVQDLDIAGGMFAPSDEELYASLASRYGGYWRYPHLLDFCYLVNPFFPPRRMLDEMKAAMDSLVRSYPSGMRVNTLLASRHFGVQEASLAVGNGAAELIRTLMACLPGTVGMVFPSFEEYLNRLDAGRVVPFVPQRAGFRYTLADLKAFCMAQHPDTLLLVNPDNPSGNYIPRNDLLELAAWTGAKNMRLVVDESFVDFASSDVPATLLDDGVLAAYPHLVVVKSLGKAYGVPGLRLGVLASGDRSLMAAVRGDLPIWNINSVGEFFLQIIVKYRGDYARSCEALRRERELFRAELSTIPFLEVFDSQANYFLCRVGERFSSRELALRCLRHNLLIKDCGTKRGLEGANCIRIAIRDREDDSRLIQVLRSL